jgi:SAM-dependent methyltransferase
MKTDYIWLDKWAGRLRNKTVLELGCGQGIDTACISAVSKKVTATDLKPYDNSKVMQLDHSSKFPFDDGSFDVVIASLCLHYFTHSKTVEIIKEISRILVKGGLIICRINSTMDHNYGAIGYPEIEKNTYSVHGRTKRFYEKQEIEEIFSYPWELLSLEHKEIDRYEKLKYVWEFGAIICV